MRTSYLILLLTILSTRLFSQSLDSAFYRNTDKINTTKELENYKDKFRFSKNNEENLNLGVVQTNWFIYKGRKSIHTNLLTISLDGQIFYREYYRHKLNEEYDGWSFEKLHVQVDTVILKRIRSNNVVFDAEHVDRFPNRSTFGYACGASGSMPDEGLSMLKLVADKDTTQLTSWLVSINPVKQAYSYLGLKLLQSRDSAELSMTTLRRKTDLENSSTLIYSCSGCTDWEYMPIKAWLTAEDVTRFVDHRKKIR
jgi:hypothetical protein